jgi:hypothetical protein
LELVTQNCCQLRVAMPELQRRLVAIQRTQHATKKAQRKFAGPFLLRRYQPAYFLVRVVK